MNIKRGPALLLCLFILAGMWTTVAAECECGIEFLRVESMEVYDVHGFDAEYHWGMAHVVYKCKSCGDKSNTNDVRYVNHTFVNGACRICGYLNGTMSTPEPTCLHPEDQLVFEEVEFYDFYEWLDITSDQHGVFVSDVYRCKACGETVKKDSISYSSHYFINGVCDMCGYRASQEETAAPSTCTHPEEQLKFVDYVEVDGIIVGIENEFRHYRVFPKIYRCGLCGEEIVKDEHLYSEHDFGESGTYCSFCNYTKVSDDPEECVHTPKETVVRTDAEQLPGDKGRHLAVTTFLVTCDCGLIDHEDNRREVVDCSFEGQTDAKHKAAGHRVYGKCVCGNESSESYKAFLVSCPVCQELGVGRGSKGDRVKELQTMLAALGLYTIAIDGDFGKGTQAAVDAFFGCSVEFVDKAMLEEIRKAYDELMNPVEETEWKFSVSEADGAVVLNVEATSGTPEGEYLLAVMPQTYGHVGEVTYYDQEIYRLTEANEYRRGFDLDLDLRLKRGNVYYFAVVPKEAPDEIGYSFEYPYDVTARILMPETGEEIDLFTSGSMFVVWGAMENAKKYEVRIMEKTNGSMELVCQKTVEAFEGALVMAEKITMEDVQSFYTEADMSREHKIQIQISALME